MMKFEAFKIANVSTAYVTESDAQKFDPEFGTSSCVMANEYGALFVVNKDEESFAEDMEAWQGTDGLSPEFVSLMVDARAHGFDYVWFDSDGGDVDGATAFEW